MGSREPREGEERTGDHRGYGAYTAVGREAKSVTEPGSEFHQGSVRK